MPEPRGRRATIPYEEDAPSGFSFTSTLGQGSFGLVKLSKNLKTGEKVAIKIVSKATLSDVEDVERVYRETFILTTLQHENIIRLHQVIDTPRSIMLVMEYAGGGELFQLLSQRGRLSEVSACAIMNEIFAGVEYCHRAKVTHRDLKLENILLDEQGKVKIADFGLSNSIKFGQKHRTHCGTPAYTCPEQILGTSYHGASADIWALGVILFALVSGFLPFEAPTIPALFNRISSRTLVFPPFLSPECVDLLNHMLCVDPAKRFTLHEARSHAWMVMSYTGLAERLRFRPQVSDAAIKAARRACQAVAVPANSKLSVRMREKERERAEAEADRLRPDTRTRLLPRGEPSVRERERTGTGTAVTERRSEGKTTAGGPRRQRTRPLTGQGMSGVVGGAGGASGATTPREDSRTDSLGYVTARAMHAEGERLLQGAGAGAGDAHGLGGHVHSARGGSSRPASSYPAPSRPASARYPAGDVRGGDAAALSELQEGLDRAAQTAMAADLARPRSSRDVRSEDATHSRKPSLQAGGGPSGGATPRSFSRPSSGRVAQTFPELELSTGTPRGSPSAAGAFTSNGGSKPYFFPLARRGAGGEQTQLSSASSTPVVADKRHFAAPTALSANAGAAGSGSVSPLTALVASPSSLAAASAVAAAGKFPLATSKLARPPVHPGSTGSARPISGRDVAAPPGRPTSARVLARAGADVVLASPREGEGAASGVFAASGASTGVFHGHAHGHGANAPDAVNGPGSLASLATMMRAHTPGGEQAGRHGSGGKSRPLSGPAVGIAPVGAEQPGASWKRGGSGKGVRFRDEVSQQSLVLPSIYQ